MNDLFITGGTVVSDGKQKTLDILIKDGRIEKIAPSMNVPEKAEVIEAVGKWILPGLIDDQVHFREPGLTHKATIATESRAAVAGGVTTYFEMPNVSPPTLDMERLEEKRAIGARDSVANYAFFLGASNENLEAVKSADPTRIAGIKIFMGSSYLARIVGQKKAREIWFLCRQYGAKEALEMGLVNKVVPVEELEKEGVQWAFEILEKSPLAIRCLKSAFNADCDGQSGLQELAGNATLLYYLSEEGTEGKKAFLEKRKPDFDKYPWLP